jgi:hypothetical protein
MLNAIIQGNKKDNLNRLGNPLSNEKNNNNIYFDEENNNNDNNNSISIYNSYDNNSHCHNDSMEISFYKENEESNRYQKKGLEKYNTKQYIYLKQKIKKDPFSVFLREMVDFILIDNNDCQIIYELRNELMQFFTSILEEKNCNEELHKLILRHLSIHRVFNSISSILKNYILSKINSNSLPKDFFIQNYYNSSIENVLIKQITTTKKTINIDNDNKQSKINNKNGNNNLNLNILKDKLFFDHRLLNFYYEHFYSNKEFYISSEFKLTNTLYKYIKIIAIWDKNEEIKTMINEAKSMSITNSIKKFEPNIINIKKEYNKNFNFNTRNIKTQLRLSKSIKTIKRNSMKPENFKTTILNYDSNAKNSNFYTSIITSEKKDDIFKSFYSNSKIISKYLSIKKATINKEDLFTPNLTNKKNNTFRTNIDNSDSSEKFLGNHKKDLKFVNNKNIIIKKNNYQKQINNNDSNTKKVHFNTSFKVIEKKKDLKYPLIPDNTKIFYDKDYIEYFYIIKFFESITSTVEVINEEFKNQTVIFNHLPEMIYLSNDSKNEFLKNVNREDELTKKNDLIRNLELFNQEIEY